MKLGEICFQITDGKHGDCRNKPSSGFYFLSAKDVFERNLSYNGVREIEEDDFLETHRRTNLQPGDLLVTNSGTIGRVAIAKDDPRTSKTTFQKSVAILKPKRNIADSLFLYYSLVDKRSRIQEVAGGTTQQNLLLKDIRDFDISLPMLPEQRAIAGILGTLDDKIELNRRMNATLESMARAVFRQWFVESEKVGDWEVGILGDVIKVNERSISKYYPHNEIEYIDISSVTTGHLEGTTPYSLVDAPSRARRLVNHGDTIWSTVRPNRRSYLFISNPKENLVVSTGFAVLTPVEISPSFLYFWVTTDEFVDYLVSNADGSAYPAVLPERFAEAEIPLPPKAMLESFENLAGAMLARIGQNEIESRTLASLRDSLLPKLMRGEVRVDGL